MNHDDSQRANYDAKTVCPKSESSCIYPLLSTALGDAQTPLAPTRSGWAAMQKNERAISETVMGGIPASLLAVSTHRTVHVRDSQNWENV
jgi:hypothetical protein